MEQQTFTIATANFDKSLLPDDSRDVGTSGFRDGVNQFFVNAFKGFGGKASISVDDERISVTWSPDQNTKPLDAIAARLQRGQRNEAIQLLELLLSRRPDDVEVLYTLGTALSDDGRFDQAQEHLRQVVELSSRFVNGLVALGVVLSRQQKNTEAISVLEQAVDEEPDNPWARLNLGATLLKVGRAADAIQHLQRAVEEQPQNQGAWLGLGDALRLSGSPREAGAAYTRAVFINPHNDFAEAARAGSSKLAQESFDKKAVGTIRMDAVEYCSAAIKNFKTLPKSEVQKITFEIAMLGTNGFDVNNPERKYRLMSMQGEFSSLALVCYLHAGLQIIAPGTDVGFDLSKEYEIAKGMQQPEP